MCSLNRMIHSNKSCTRPSKRLRSTEIISAFIVVVLFTAIQTEAKELVKRVLVINSFHPTHKWTKLEMQGITSALHKYEGLIERDVEYLDTKHFKNTEHYENLYRLYKHKAGWKKHDLIITTDDNALSFLLKYHDELYPDIPVVFCGVGSSDFKKIVADYLGSQDYITGVTEGMIYLSTIEIALKLHPSAKQVVILTGNKKWWEKKQRGMSIIRKYGTRIKFVRHILLEPEQEQVLNKLDGLGDESIVLLTGSFHKDGRLVSFKNSKALIEERCAAPIYALTQRWFDKAPVVGGVFNNAVLQGEYAGEMAVRILSGESIQDIPIQLAPTRRYMFDRGQLKRFKIPLSKLPEGSMIINEPQSFYYIYKKYIWTTAAAVLVLLIIILLLSINNIHRKKVEKKLLNYQSKLKSLASELSLTEERERRRIAAQLHDRISQSLVMSKVKLEALCKSESPSDFGESLNEICDMLDKTIQNTKLLTFDLSSPVLHELGFEAAVADWLSEHVESKYCISSHFEYDGQAKPMDEDVRSLLFRNIQELLINVIKHSQANKVEVYSRKVNSQIHVSIEDDGVGFDTLELDSKPSRAGGFGLFSIRERLEHIGGRLEIESKPGHGTRVKLMVPLKE